MVLRNFKVYCRMARGDHDAHQVMHSSGVPVSIGTLAMEAQLLFSDHRSPFTWGLRNIAHRTSAFAVPHSHRTQALDRRIESVPPCIYTCNYICAQVRMYINVQSVFDEVEPKPCVAPAIFRHLNLQIAPTTPPTIAFSQQLAKP